MALSPLSNTMTADTLVFRKQKPQKVHTTGVHGNQSKAGKTRKYMYAMRLDHDESLAFKAAMRRNGVKSLGDLIRKLLVNQKL